MSKKETLNVSFLMQGANIHLYINGECNVINKETHINFDELVKALVDEDWETAAKLANVEAAFQEYASKDGSVKIEIRQNSIMHNGEKLHDALGNRLFEMAKANLPIQFFIEFMARRDQNPSKRATEELFGMMEYNTLPITPRGLFNAYKAVKRHEGAPFKDVHGRLVTHNDYVDIYTGKIRNNVGDEVSMPRNKVCDDKNVTCAEGLHVTSLDYAKSFGGRKGSMIIVEVDPADVVSVPTDYNNQKLRCCKYTVVKVHAEGALLAEEAFSSPVSNIGYKRPDGPRYQVVSTNKDNLGDVLDTFTKRQAARDYAGEFTDAKVVDTWAIAKFNAAVDAANKKLDVSDSED